jgi:predicted NBD/HSP70 family sugar kinase
LARKKADTPAERRTDPPYPPPGAIGPEHLLTLIRTGAATSRGALARVTGLSRSTVAQRVDALIEAGYVREGGPGTSSGGRPPAVLEFDGSRKLVLTVAIDPAELVVGLVNFAGEVIGRRICEVRVTDGPAVVLPLVEAELRALISEHEVQAATLSGIGVSVPAPVEHLTGRPIEPTIMPGWHDCPIREKLEDTFALPVYVDNDANVMALGEYRSLESVVGTMFYVRASDGIGAGLVLDGKLYRGAAGAAGALGHVAVDGGTALCTCGNVGCVAAVASGRALARLLREAGLDTARAADVAEIAQQGQPDATAALRMAGRYLGRVLAGVVNLLDPGAVVIGGELAEVRDFMAGIREEVYGRALPLAAGHLQILKASLGEDAAIKGAGTMVSDELLAPRPVLDLITNLTPARNRAAPMRPGAS